MTEQGKAPAARKCRSIASVYCDQDVKCQICRDFDALAGAVADLLNTMEMQEKRESGEFHITADVAWGIWADAKARGRNALRATGYIASEREPPKAPLKALEISTLPPPSDSKG